VRVISRILPSVRLSVDNDRELWKNGRLDRDAVWDGGSGGMTA